MTSRRPGVDFEGLENDPEVRAIRELAQAGSGQPFVLRKIGHVVLRVTDLRRSAAFYTGVLGLSITDVYPGTMMPGGMVFMRLGTDHHGIALVGGGDADVASSGGLHHFAFEVGSLDEVIRARDHLVAHGVDLDFEGRRRAGCQVAIEFRDPDGHHLEIYWGLDQIGSDGRSRPPEQWREALTLDDAIATPPLGQDTTRFKVPT